MLHKISTNTAPKNESFNILMHILSNRKLLNDENVSNINKHSKRDDLIEALLMIHKYSETLLTQHTFNVISYEINVGFPCERNPIDKAKAIIYLHNADIASACDFEVLKYHYYPSYMQHALQILKSKNALTERHWALIKHRDNPISLAETLCSISPLQYSLLTAFIGFQRFSLFSPVETQTTINLTPHQSSLLMGFKE